MSSLRIGIITDRIEPFYRGGYERRYHDLALNMSKKHEVHVFTCCPLNTTSSGRLYYHNTAPQFNFFTSNSRNLTFDIFWSFRLPKILEYDLDVIDCNFTPLIHVIPVKMLSSLKDSKLLLTVHEAFTRSWLMNYFASNRGKYKLPWLVSNFSFIASSLAVKVADALISVSNITQKSLEQNFAINSTVIPNGIDFSALSANYSAQRSQTPQLIYTGRLVKEKNLGTVFCALRNLKKQGRRFKMKIIGYGPDFSRLNHLAEQLNLCNEVIFLGDISDDEKLHELQSSDIFIMPSLREGFSIATLEAMAAGLPVIAAVPQQREAQGILEIISDRENGLTYSAEKYEELAERIELLLDDESLRYMLAKNAIAKARQYDWSKVIPLYEDLLLRTVANRVSFN